MSLLLYKIEKSNSLLIKNKQNINRLKKLFHLILMTLVYPKETLMIGLTAQILLNKMKLQLN